MPADAALQSAADALHASQMLRTERQAALRALVLQSGSAQATHAARFTPPPSPPASHGRQYANNSDSVRAALYRSSPDYASSSINSMRRVASAKFPSFPEGQVVSPANQICHAAPISPERVASVPPLSLVGRMVSDTEDDAVSAEVSPRGGFPARGDLTQTASWKVPTPPLDPPELCTPPSLSPGRSSCPLAVSVANLRGGGNGIYVRTTPGLPDSGVSVRYVLGGVGGVPQYTLYQKGGRWRLNAGGDTGGWLFSSAALLGQWCEDAASGDTAVGRGWVFPVVLEARRGEQQQQQHQQHLSTLSPREVKNNNNNNNANTARTDARHWLLWDAPLPEREGGSLTSGWDHSRAAWWLLLLIALAAGWVMHSVTLSEAVRGSAGNAPTAPNTNTACTNPEAQPEDPPYTQHTQREPDPIEPVVEDVVQESAPAEEAAESTAEPTEAKIEEEAKEVPKKKVRRTKRIRRSWWSW